MRASQDLPKTTLLSLHVLCLLSKIWPPELDMFFSPFFSIGFPPFSTTVTTHPGASSIDLPEEWAQPVVTKGCLQRRIKRRVEPLVSTPTDRNGVEVSNVWS